MRSYTNNSSLYAATSLLLLLLSSAARAAPFALQQPEAAAGAAAETRQSVDEEAAAEAAAEAAPWADRLTQLAGLAQVAADWPGAAGAAAAEQQQQRWRVVPWPVGVPLPPGAEVVGQWPPPGQAPGDEGGAQWLAEGDDPQRRNDKALAYFQLFQPYLAGYGGDEIEGDPDSALDAFSRAGGLRLPLSGAGTRRKPFPDSPVYYIRMPAAPYVFVPGLGYVSQPPPPPPPPRRSATYNPFINVPVEFVSNGKPTGVYRWQGRPAPTTTTTPKPALQQSPVNTLDKGPYLFNGKPSRVHVLRDQYNVLYADALQNFYP